MAYQQVEIKRFPPRLDKATFFRRPTIVDIKKGKNPIRLNHDLIGRIDQLDPKNEYIVISLGQHGMIPQQYYANVPKKHPNQNPRQVAARAFMKHAPPVELEQVNDTKLETLVADKMGMHVAFRKRAFDATQERREKYAGYTFKPVINKDGQVITEDHRKRHVPLVECMQAAMILFYWRHSTANFDVNPLQFHNAPDRANQFRAAQEQGLHAFIKVPSSQPKGSRYTLQLDFLPFIERNHEITVRTLAFSVASTHDCERMRQDVGYGNDRIYFDRHAIAAYFALAAHYISMTQESTRPGAEVAKFRSLRRNSPFALPTEKQMQFYWKLLNNVAIEAPDKEGTFQLYPLNMAEQEILLWGSVWKHGHDPTYFPEGKIKLHQYEFGPFTRIEEQLFLR